MSNLVEHAKREFKALGYIPLDQEQDDDPNKWIQENVLELLEVFSKQGHSGSSAPYCISMFTKLADFKPLKPITCEDNEWNDTGHGFQNKRLSAVFKDGKDGKPYYIEAIVFKGQNGLTFTSSSVELSDGVTIASRQFIRLPFTPKTFYIDVIETEWHKDRDTGELTKQDGGGWWTSIVKDKNQLKAVAEYYQCDFLKEPK